MRLTQIKLAGFKSFVDPTSIGTPGQLVGIVGPNGCGKSNVIDAVRWVLGESKASALRGESMQDVIFNGAGERKPVGRASVELAFDNSQGRIGGQWGQYGELSIKRVLARDGESSYYINGIPVRRRDIHDLFLGTGLGPRAYAIIEQGMISRVIEAKPEELRIFLEEAAGVSKYKERRKETEARLADTRENLTRVEDIRLELAQQLTKLEAQAKVAHEFRELEARLKETQHLAWFAKQQDALRQRDRHVAEIASLTAALDALLAELRASEAKIEHLRTDHYASGDALHERQGAFYAANAEVSRLEQQLKFARDREGRIAQQVAQLSEQVAGLASETDALEKESREAERAVQEAAVRQEHARSEERAAQDALPALETALADAVRALAARQDAIAAFERDLRVLETRTQNADKVLAAIAQRRERLHSEGQVLAARDEAPIATVREQLAQERADLSAREGALGALRDEVQALQDTLRSAGERWQQASRALADLEGREQALAALQAKIGRAQDAAGFLSRHGLEHATRLWQAIDIEPGWEDALESILRERLNALALASLDAALAWVGDAEALPGRIAAFERTTRPEGTPSASGRLDDLAAKVRAPQEISRLLADGLAGVRCMPDFAAALEQRATLAAGECFVTRQGHVVSAQGVAFFAPDSELHGVLARQRELAELAQALGGARARHAEAAQALDVAEKKRNARQQDYHAEGLALASQQRRCHDLELELLQLTQAAEATARRRAQIADEVAVLDREEDAERASVAAMERETATARGAYDVARAARGADLSARDMADAALAAGRDRRRGAERAAQDAGYAERTARDRVAELARRRESLGSQIAQHQDLLAQLAGERQQIDWAPVEAELQMQLAARTEAEAALASARDQLEGLGTALRAAEEERLAVDQRTGPARARIEDMRLKEQAAALAEAQFAEQLADARADTAALPDKLKAFGRASGLASEIERLTQAIAGLGAINMAALDEVTQAAERKSYLDAQAADLMEAMTTLESAIRQIDRESRDLLQQTFDTVNANFARLFPALFGGGQAHLALTGEEILDSGVHVTAQPPGKRNTSIHVLSGGEKALTAIALVFALFQLNPAPFCLLDEVDAPLDDPNTERFCTLVRQMAEVTQFLFISHNKITMEMASQLVGITMPDPGVSRVVAVDIAEAIEFAESATS